jgi:hypothetical protein
MKHPKNQVLQFLIPSKQKMFSETLLGLAKGGIPEARPEKPMRVKQ